MRSDLIKKGIERAPHRSLMKAMGYTNEEINRPLIGIAHAHNEIIPGHIHLDKIVDAVKAGVRMAGGSCLRAQPQNRTARARKIMSDLRCIV